LAISASAGHSAQVEVLDPRALALESEGRTALMAGDVGKAIDGFEAALAIQPGSNRITLIWPRPRARGNAGQGAALLPPRADQRSAKS
jgi:hypothetical protein